MTLSTGMSDDHSQTTLDPTIRLRGAIASAIAIVCSDSNSDVKRVVDDVIACIKHSGFKIVDVKNTKAG